MIGEIKKYGLEMNPHPFSKNPLATRTRNNALLKREVGYPCGKRGNFVTIYNGGGKGGLCGEKGKKEKKGLTSSSRVPCHSHKHINGLKVFYRLLKRVDICPSHGGLSQGPTAQGRCFPLNAWDREGGDSNRKGETRKKTLMENHSLSTFSQWWTLS